MRTGGGNLLAQEKTHKLLNTIKIHLLFNQFYPIGQYALNPQFYTEHLNSGLGTGGNPGVYIGPDGVLEFSRGTRRIPEEFLKNKEEGKIGDE